jgi:thiol:disulfide interchange protein DsbD
VPLIGLGQTFNNYSEAIEYAEKVNKPVFITFTAFACVNCRMMEENVFPEVESLLKKYVICQLYVDDRTKLTTPETVIVPTYNGGIRKKTLETFGDKWSMLQFVTYKASSQPYHVLYSWKDVIIAEPLGYTPDYKEFAKWIEGGINNFYKE